MPGLTSALFAPRDDDPAVEAAVAIDLDVAIALDTAWSVETDEGSWSGGREIALETGLHVDQTLGLGWSAADDGIAIG